MLRLLVDVDVIQLKTLLKQLARRLDILSLFLVQLFCLGYGHRLFKHAELLPMVLSVAVFQSLAKRFQHFLAHRILFELIDTLIIARSWSLERLLLLFQCLERLRLMDLGQRGQQAHISHLSLFLHGGAGFVSSLFIIVRFY